MAVTRNTLSRLRRALAQIALIAALVLGVPTPGARADSTDATELLRDFYQALIQTMQNGPTLGSEGRYARLESVIASTFDIDFMAQSAVGPVWHRLSGAQQDRLTAAFKRYVVATYADNFSAYSGEALMVLGATPAKPGCIVQSRIVKDGVAVEINYLMSQDGAAWRIRDVYLGGMISELAVRRSQFMSILRRDGVDGLIELLDRKADTLIQTAAA